MLACSHLCERAQFGLGFCTCEQGQSDFGLECCGTGAALTRRGRGRRFTFLDKMIPRFLQSEGVQENERITVHLVLRQDGFS